MWWTPNIRKGASYSYAPSRDDQEGLLRRYDADGDGRLSKKELQAALKELGLSYSRSKAVKALRHADADRDGYIGRDEMKGLVQYIKKWF